MNSFVGKFVRLWQSGYNATLSFESKSGETEVQLKVGLGKLPPVPHQTNQTNFHHQRIRVPGPSRQRRQQRRAEERKAAEQATKSAVSEEANVNEDTHDEEAEEATNESEIDPCIPGNIKIVPSEKIAVKAVDSDDFTCDLCDSNFKNLTELKTHEVRKHKAALSSPIPQLDGFTDASQESNDEIDNGSEPNENDNEKKIDRIVNKVLIAHVTKSKVCNQEIENEVKTKFGEIGVNVLNLKFVDAKDGAFNFCIADISPVNLNKIWDRRLGVTNCSLISYYP